MQVLIDTSIWIDFFRSGINSQELDVLIDENLVVINDLILTELIPFLRMRNQTSIIKAITAISILPLSVDWREIQEFQFKCLKAGVNGVGIPDLIIVQNSKQNDSYIFTLDKHFRLLQDVLKFRIYGPGLIHERFPE